MIKPMLISIMMLGMSSCSYLASHPQVEADLESEVVDIAKDSEKVVEDVIMPSEKAAL